MRPSPPPFPSLFFFFSSAHIVLPYNSRYRFCLTLHFGFRREGKERPPSDLAFCLLPFSDHFRPSFVHLSPKRIFPQVDTKKINIFLLYRKVLTPLFPPSTPITLPGRPMPSLLPNAFSLPGRRPFPLLTVSHSPFFRVEPFPRAALLLPSFLTFSVIKRCRPCTPSSFAPSCTF